MDVRKLVVFAILMENNDGILGKHPFYVLEKWEAINKASIESLLGLLDYENQLKYNEWKRKWNIETTE
jgi:hypothetical protein